MACNFITDIAENGTKFKLIFECDSKDEFVYMIEAARTCVDGGPRKQLIKRLEEENLRIQQQALMGHVLSQFTGPVPTRFEKETNNDT